MSPEIIDAVRKYIERHDLLLNAIDPHELAAKIRHGYSSDNGQPISVEEDNWLLTEILPLQLSEGERGNANPWQSYFGPISSMKYDDGTVIHIPNPFDADVNNVDSWKRLAATLQHPVLKARYADVVWEFAHRITPPAKREIAFAKLAIENYIKAAANGLAHDEYAKVTYLQRAFDLAVLIDEGQVVHIKLLLLAEHRAAHENLKIGFVFRVFDHLESQKRLGLTKNETKKVIADFESALTSFSSTSAETFDPHFASMVCKRLIAYYSKKSLPNEMLRISSIEARAFEFAASTANASLASSFLADALQIYKSAKMHEEAERIRKELEKTIDKSHTEMAIYTHENTISDAEKLEFEISVIANSPLKTLIGIAYNFLPRVESLTLELQETAKTAVLFSMIPISIVGNDHVVAKVGGLKDDLKGRLVMAAHQYTVFCTVWLRWALDAAIKSHSLTPEDFVGCCNRGGLFDDARTGLLLDGFKAWYEEDHSKAIHLLVPQIEHALRSLTRKLGHATTKEHPKLKGVSTSIGMGDVLFDEKIISTWGEFGPDVRLYLLSVYADPRGLNLRNRLAHGLLDTSDLTDGVTVWIVHTLILLAFTPF